MRNNWSRLLLILTLGMDNERADFQMLYPRLDEESAKFSVLFCNLLFFIMELFLNHKQNVAIVLKSD